jgi:hypothetical protein
MITNTADLEQRLKMICSRKTPPGIDEYSVLLTETISILETEPDYIRPAGTMGAFKGKPGGIIYLFRDIPTIIVPDLHARMDFIVNLIYQKDNRGTTNLEKLSGGLLQIVCVGDGFHSEGRGAARWRKSFDEFATLYKNHSSMDDEMRESLGLMEMVMNLKSTFPLHFHFLKGNHENILNEKGWGNYPFRKYAYEGAMVLEYVKKFYGSKFLRLYYVYEKNLPVFAVGKNFLVSHAEPRTKFDRDSIVNYREHPEVISGLTWTDNGEAEPGSVEKMLEYYLGKEASKKGYHFGGHRAVDDTYALRASGRYVQIHNPKKNIIAYIDPNREISLDRDIVEIRQTDAGFSC